MNYKYRTLENKLSETLENFKLEIQGNMDFIKSREEYELTSDDYDFLAKNTFYVLTDFKTAILTYLKGIAK